MDFSEGLMQEYQEQANKKLALACRYMFALVVLVIILSQVGVIGVPAEAYIIFYITLGVLFLPTIFYNICRFDSKLTRYSILSMLTLMMAALVSVLSYHVLILMVIPLILSCLYRDRKCMIFTITFGLICLIAANCGAYVLAFYPDPSISKWSDVFGKAILPRVAEYGAVAIVALAINNCFSDLVEKLNQTSNQMYHDQESLISSLSTMVEMQSQETGQHVRRVSEYTKILCRALGYDEKNTWKIGLAAMMHDVGKIAVPREILEKPGKLTDEEYVIIKRHIFYGKEILEQYPGEIMQLSANIAYEHHENWDGSGYMGLKGDEISREAQCVALADFFDALVSKRSYKKAWSPEQARSEILAHKGEYFEPYLVNLFDIHFSDFLEVYRTYPD